MKSEDLTALINRVIGSKGILRTPAWWVRKLLLKIIEYIDSFILSIEETRIYAENTSLRALEEANKELIIDEEVLAFVLHDMEERIKKLEDNNEIFS